MLQKLTRRLRKHAAFRSWLCGPSYYLHLHTHHDAYARNNWLVSELPRLRSLTPSQSILEIGCGNGRFLEEAAGKWEFVVGADWARAPALEDVLATHSNVRFCQGNACKLSTEELNVPADGFGLVVSADFLEHIGERDLPALLSKLHSWGKVNFHKIACYDDNHSHLSVLSSRDWLDLFRANDPNYRILAESEREPGKVVIVVTNASE